MDELLDGTFPKSSGFIPRIHFGEEPGRSVSEKGREKKKKKTQDLYRANRLLIIF